MPGSDPLTHALAVPGARLYYERRGTGPLPLLIVSPMDSAGLAGLAAAMAGDYTVVTYDPRGIGNSSCQDPGQDVTPEQQADDVHRLLSALGGEPAYVFGSSGGAVGGVAPVTAHPGPVRGGGAPAPRRRGAARRARPGHRAPRPGAQAGRPRTSGGRVAVRQRPAAPPDPGHLRHLPGRGG